MEWRWISKKWSFKQEWQNTSSKVSLQTSYKNKINSLRLTILTTGKTNQRCALVLVKRQKMVSRGLPTNMTRSRGIIKCSTYPPKINFWGIWTYGTKLSFTSSNHKITSGLEKQSATICFLWENIRKYSPWVKTCLFDFSKNSHDHLDIESILCLLCFLPLYYFPSFFKLLSKLKSTWEVCGIMSLDPRTRFEPRLKTLSRNRNPYFHRPEPSSGFHYT